MTSTKVGPQQDPPTNNGAGALFIIPVSQAAEVQCPVFTKQAIIEANAASEPKPQDDKDEKYELKYFRIIKQILKTTSRKYWQIRVVTPGVVEILLWVFALAIDIALCSLYLSKNDDVWGGLTLAFVLYSAFTTAILDIRHLLTEDNRPWRVVAAVAGLSVPARTLDLILYHWNIVKEHSRPESYKKRLKPPRNIHNVEKLYWFHRFGQNYPQLCLQLIVLFQGRHHGLNLFVLQLVCAFISLTSLSWHMIKPDHTGPSISLLGKFILFLVTFLVTLSRTIIVAAMVSVTTGWFQLIILVVFCWSYIQLMIIKIGKFHRDEMLHSFIMFTHVQFISYYNGSKFALVHCMHYLLCLVINSALLVAYVAISPHWTVVKWLVTFTVLLAPILALTLQAAYLKLCDPLCAQYKWTWPPLSEWGEFLDLELDI